MSVGKAVELGTAVVLLSVAGYLLFPHLTSLLTPPCTVPLPYSISALDTRFGVSEAAVRAALIDAETVWEEAAGRDLFTLEEEGGISVSLVYSEEQKTNELGEVIDAEQEGYNAQKASLEGLKRTYNRAKSRYETEAAAFDARAARYHEEVQRWNTQGGAPPAEYARLSKEQEALEEMQKALNSMAQEVNDAAATLNTAVDALNALAKKLNAKVNTYNERAGDAFDQGDYQEDTQGKRISVYEFTDAADLRRVLAHEFGHALGIPHVEDPGSIMYSFNAGSTLELSEDDVVALRAVCRLD
jgi:hypothetical protein